MPDNIMSSKNRMITLKDEDDEVIEHLKENRAGGFNLSSFVRNQLREKFPEQYE